MNPFRLLSCTAVLLATACNDPRLERATATTREALILGAPTLVKDINGVVPTGVTSSSPTRFITFQGVTYFAATEVVTGNELWRTDGTVAGTYLVADLNSGTSSSTPDDFTIFNGELYFTATDGNTGIELWKTKGTSGTTELVTDIYPGTSSSSPTNLRVAGPTLFFTATDGTATGVGHGYELWKTTGGIAERVTDLNPGTASGLSSTTGLISAALGNRLVFAGTDGTSGTELYISDGTAAGTTLLLDINVGTSSSSPTNMLVKDANTLLFTALGGTPAAGTELWRTDGTPAGTTLVTDLYPGTSSASPSNLTLTSSGRVFFSAITSATGRELFVTDGTASGTSLVLDIRAGTTASTPANLVAVGSTLYFTATNGIDGIELWKSDGTAVGTTLVKDLYTGASSSSPSPVFAAAGTLFFTATTGTTAPSTGLELYTTDGTNAGTVLVKDINPGTASGLTSTNAMVEHNGALLFPATDGVNGIELWKSDGTAAGTTMLEDLNPARTNDASPTNLTAVGTMVFFTATDGIGGSELGVSEGTGATTRQFDLYPGSSASSPSNLIALGNKLIFAATNGTTAPGVGRELWISDGTDAGTMLLKDIDPGTASSSPANVTLLGNTVFFSAATTAEGTELWKTDGTAAGTVAVGDFSPGTGDFSPTTLTPFGQKLLFSGFETGTFGRELWITDGTTAGTSRVVDLNPGSNSSSPANLTVIGATAYFTANDGTNGIALWKTDGTAAGTVMVKDIITTGTTSASISQLTAAGGILFFIATDGTTGIELWKSDGTAAGTAMVKEIGPGALAAGITSLTAVGNIVMFSANDPVSGEELWKSDGTAAGTVIVRDILPGPRGSSPVQFLASGPMLIFSADNGLNGQELWLSDGTFAGTTMAADLNPKSSGVPLAGALAGTKYFFSAFDPGRGRELFVGPVIDNLPPVVTCPQNVTGYSNGAMGPVVYPPATAIDDVTASPMVSYSQASGTPFPLGPTVVTVTATDDALNTAQCTFTINVLSDTQNPVASCPANITANTPNMAGATLTYPAATATDDQTPSPSIGYSKASGTLFPTGVTTVTATATDLAGNQGTCAFTVTVTFVDQTPPVITCPANQMKVVNAMGPTPVTYPPATATDAVTPNPAITYSHPSGAMFPIGTTIVTATATDLAGNSSACTFNVAVSFVDNTPPVITCPSNQTALSPSMQGVVVVYPSATATDAVTLSPFITYSKPSNTLFPVGETTVQATATDAAGNAASCTFKVTVTFTDSSPPVITCPVAQDAVTNTNAPSPVAYPPATAFDAVTANPAITYSHPSGSDFPIGTTSVTATAKDAANNNASCTFTVTLRYIDVAPPSITCPSNQTATTTGTDAQVTFPPAMATENAAIAYTKLSGSSFVLGETKVTAKATDTSGNSASCSFTVTVSKGTPKPMGGGCGCSAGGEASSLLLAGLGLIAIRRRRTR